MFMKKEFMLELLDVFEIGMDATNLKRNREVIEEDEDDEYMALHRKKMNLSSKKLKRKNSSLSQEPSVKQFLKLLKQCFQIYKRSSK